LQKKEAKSVAYRYDEKSKKVAVEAHSYNRSMAKGFILNDDSVIYTATKKSDNNLRGYLPKW